jgi:farnesyl diphosphate synthase
MKIERFEAYLKASIPKVKSIHPHYNEALCQMFNAGGKRFRPMALLGVVEALSPMSLESALKPAVAIEFLHTYSLIHDDLPAMDDADLRRGVETLHKSYDDVTAILVGDALNTEAFNLLAESSLHPSVVVDLVKSLAKAGGLGGMVLGQAIDCHFENQKLSLDELIFLHNHKTGVLIASAFYMGAIIADCDTSLKDALYDFGLDVGLLFQINDDIIDVTQSTEEAGKTTSNDSEKNSFVNLLGLEGAIVHKERLLSSLDKKSEQFDSTALKHFLLSVLKKFR